MYKILFFVHLWVMTMVALPIQSIEVNYDITYAVFGKIGESKAILTIDQNRYKIHIEAKATGIAKLMSHQRYEVYNSEGIVYENNLIPSKFTASIKKGDNFTITNHYHFDYEQKKIKHIETTTEGQNTKQHKNEILPFFAHNDILTLFFNLKYYLKKDNCAHKGCKFTAIGANEKDAKVDIYNVDLKTNNLSVILHRRIFASKEGKINIHLTPEGLCADAILKDVIFFGDVKAKATKIVTK